MKKEIYILGVGRNTVNIIDLAIDCGYEIAALIHYNEERTGEKYFGYTIEGSFAEFLIPEKIGGKNVALSMGDFKIKENLYNSLKEMGAIIPALVHPTAYVSRQAIIEDGVLIQPHCVVEGDTIIGENTTLVVNSVVHHSTSIGKNNLISGNSLVGAYCVTGSNVHIGQGAVVVSGKAGSIGNNCILGAGSVLLTNMPEETIFVGNPARFLKYNH